MNLDVHVDYLNRIRTGDAENNRLTAELVANAKMLARQTDLAREAETQLAEQRTEARYGLAIASQLQRELRAANAQLAEAKKEIEKLKSIPIIRKQKVKNMRQGRKLLRRNLRAAEGKLERVRDVLKYIKHRVTVPSDSLEYSFGGRQLCLDVINKCEKALNTILTDESEASNDA